MSLYFMALPKLFTKCRDSGANTEDLNENTVTENAARVSEILDVTESLPVDKGTAETLRVSENITTLPPQLDPLTPNKINSFATLRNAVGNLEAESQLLRHASYSNAVKNKPPYTHHWPHNLQTQPSLIPLVKPPAPHQTYTANTQIPPAQHQTGPHPSNTTTSRKTGNCLRRDSLLQEQYGECTITSGNYILSTICEIIHINR